MTTLGICIPTYKRPDFLFRCVKSAILSAESRPISIFISDDSESVINSDVYDLLLNEYESIYIHINTKNIGIDGNIQQVVSLCDCDFAWLIGEDDEFLPGAVSKMYDFLQNRTDVFIFSAYQYVSEDHSRSFELVNVSDVYQGYVDAETFLQNFLWTIGFIGAVVINMQAWSFTTAQPYLGTYFTHVGRIVDMLANKSNVLVSNNIAVSNRIKGENTFTWKSDSYGVFLGFEKMCQIAAIRNPSIDLFCNEAANQYRKKSAYLSIKTTFRLRSEGAFNCIQFKKYIFHNDSIAIWIKIWLFFISLIPSMYFKPFVKLYKKWNNFKIKIIG